MKFAQFYHLSTGYIKGTTPPVFSEENRKPIEACGSNAVLPLDGRYGANRMHSEAAKVCRERGFIGYSLHAGSFLQNRELCSFVAI